MTLFADDPNWQQFGQNVLQSAGVEIDRAGRGVGAASGPRRDE